MTKKVAPAIVVSGEATVRSAPDLAVVMLSINARNRQPGPARDEANSRTSAIISSLRELGLEERNIQAASLVLNPTYDYGRGTPKLTGYEAARPMTLRITDIDLLGRALDRLVDDGATNVQGTSMQLADPEVATQRALAQAVSVARARAESLATASGITLGTVIRVEETGAGGPSPRPMAMLRMADTEAAATETAPGEIETTVSVRVWFAAS